MNRNKIYMITLAHSQENPTFFCVAPTANKAKSLMLSQAKEYDAEFKDIRAEVLRNEMQYGWFIDTDTSKQKWQSVAILTPNNEPFVYAKDLPEGMLEIDTFIRFLRENGDIAYLWYRLCFSGRR